MKKSNYTPIKNSNIQTNYPQNTFLNMFQSIAYQNSQNTDIKIQSQQINNKNLLPTLKHDESQIWKRKLFEIQNKQQKYFTQFKSIHFQGIATQSNQQQNEVQKYKNAIIKPSKKYVIQDIINQNQQIPKYNSNLDFPQYTINDYIRTPALYSLNFSNEFEKQNCYKISQELRYENRDIFKHRQNTEKKNSNSQQILDLKLLNNDVYKQVIIQKHSNQIFNSIIKNYGSISLDQYVQLPEKYEIKQKKDFQSIEINTDEVQTERFSAFNTIKKVDLLKLEIERQKKRKTKAKDYFKVMQNKLIEYLDYIVKDEPQILQLEVSEKIKYILKDLNKYKGKQIQGELKTTLLLYFFREFKLLKDEKDEYEKKLKIQQQSKKKKKQTNIALKQAPQFQFKILPTAEKKPMIPTKQKKVVPPPRNPKEEDSWIGILKQ